EGATRRACRRVRGRSSPCACPGPLHTRSQEPRWAHDRPGRALGEQARDLRADGATDTRGSCPLAALRSVAPDARAHVLAAYWRHGRAAPVADARPVSATPSPTRGRSGMKLSRTTRIGTTATVTGLLALGALVGSASAAGFTLSLTASSTPVVGKPLILTATGTTPLEDLEFPYFFSLDAIPTNVTTTCPADR